MSFNALVKAVVVLLCLLVIAGCEPQGPAPAEQEQVKTAAEYKAEAEKEITEENMDQELAALEQAVDAEAAQTP
jgi:predicted small lipoprotein YifL